MDVVGQLLDALPEQARGVTAWGEVTAATPLTVQLAGDTAGSVVSLSLDGYTATVGDTVVLLRVGSKWAVLGKVA